jgi:hypothetical protein
VREVPGSIPGAALCFCLGGYLGEPCGSHSCTCCLAAPFQCNVKESRTVLLKADSFAGQANHTLFSSLAENVWCPNTEKIVAHASRQQHVQYPRRQLLMQGILYFVASPRQLRFESMHFRFLSCPHCFQSPLKNLLCWRYAPRGLTLCNRDGTASLLDCSALRRPAQM